MIVELLAKTVLLRDAAKNMGYVPHAEGSTSDGDELAEVAGRECYQSWQRPNVGTAHNQGYTKNIINHRHFSVLEHAQYTFSIREVSRALTHELVRHRHLSFSQQSQRYVDESDGVVVIPPELRPFFETSGLDFIMTDDHQESITRYKNIVDLLTEAGVPRKRARQAARYALPNGHATRLVVSGNVRAWREMLEKRIGRDPLTGEPHADLEHFEMAQKILTILHEEVPNSVQDLWDAEQAWLKQAELRKVTESSLKI